jgi:DNA-binding LacI/PurR family transcriptional regulator
MAKGFCEAAREHNYEIPKDIALLSYDDLPMCQQLKPQLSSINTDFYELGLNTLKSLNDLITDKNEYKSSLSFIPVSLSERDST